jgi:hypothetical protein
VDDGSSAISQFGTGAAGALSPLSPRAVPTGSDNSFNVAVTPNGTSAYVTNGLLRSVSQYTINSTDGTLSAMSPPIVATGADNYGGAVSPDGKNAYVTNAIDNTVSQSNINSLTGALTPKVPAPVPTGSIPQSIVVSPNGANASHVRCSFSMHSDPTIASVERIAIDTVFPSRSRRTAPLAGGRRGATSTDRDGPEDGGSHLRVGEHHIDDRKRHELAAL